AASYPEEAGYSRAEPEPVESSEPYGYIPAGDTRGALLGREVVGPGRSYSAPAVFGRQLAAHALDTAALPVKLAGKAALALGSNAKAAHQASELDAQKTMGELLAYLNDRGPAEQRRVDNASDRAHPIASAGGAVAGDLIGGLPGGALTEAAAGKALAK